MIQAIRAARVVLVGMMLYLSLAAQPQQFVSANTLGELLEANGVTNVRVVPAPFLKNPERFDSALGYFVVNETTHAIAFTVSYSNPINDAHDAPSERRDVITTCTSLNRVEYILCKERNSSAWVQATNNASGPASPRSLIFQLVC